MGICKKKQSYETPGDEDDSDEESGVEETERDETIGRKWIWTAMDVPTRLLICFHVGNRELEDARKHLVDLSERLVGIPMFTSDELVHYESVLKSIYSHKVEVLPTGKRGRPRKPIEVIDEELVYATVKKQRLQNSVVKVRREIVFGTEELVSKRLEQSPSNTINTSYIERSNGDWRIWDAHLTRKSYCFSKSIEWLKAKLAIVIFVYNFIRPHSRLVNIVDGRKIPTTPAMAAKLTTRPWKYEELVSGILSCQ
jgi:IS1 family transposase